MNFLWQFVFWCQKLKFIDFSLIFPGFFWWTFRVLSEALPDNLQLDGLDGSKPEILSAFTRKIDWKTRQNCKIATILGFAGAILEWNKTCFYVPGLANVKKNLKTVKKI